MSIPTPPQPWFHVEQNPELHPLIQHLEEHTLNADEQAAVAIALYGSVENAKASGVVFNSIKEEGKQ